MKAREPPSGTRVLPPVLYRTGSATAAPCCISRCVTPPVLLPLQLAAGAAAGGQGAASAWSPAWRTPHGQAFESMSQESSWDGTCPALSALGSRAPALRWSSFQRYATERLQGTPGGVGAQPSAGCAITTATSQGGGRTRREVGGASSWPAPHQRVQALGQQLVSLRVGVQHIGHEVGADGAVVGGQEALAAAGEGTGRYQGGAGRAGGGSSSGAGRGGFGRSGQLASPTPGGCCRLSVGALGAGLTSRGSGGGRPAGCSRCGAVGWVGVGWGRGRAWCRRYSPGVQRGAGHACLARELPAAQPG